MNSDVITRFAPSPTGSLHLGNARTAFYSYLWARKCGGRFILRIEDTDVDRSEDRFREQLMDDLKWLGLVWDEGPDIGGPHAPYMQAARVDIYARYFAQLRAGEEAYLCYCTAQELELSRKLQRMAGKPPRYAGTCRNLTASQRAEREERGLKPSIRFKVPADRTIEFVDSVHGPQRFVSNDIGDFIIGRDNGTAAFFFSNAIDDSLMGVTQVLRGDDHLTNTPRQLMVLDALALRRPGYGHVGLLLGADGTPLSKRHGSTSVHEFRERGFRPEAVLNHLFHLGHSSDGDAWVDPDDMPARFRPDHLHRAAARFDEMQLLHWQKEAIHRMHRDDLAAWLEDDIPPMPAGVDTAAFIDLVRNNVVLPLDVETWASAIYGQLPEPVGEARAALDAAGKGFFQSAVEAFDRTGADLKSFSRLLNERTGRSGAQLFMPLRIALTGQAHGPELAQMLKLMPPALARSRLQSHA
jgi:glutamyl-tRNA synthetase